MPQQDVRSQVVRGPLQNVSIQFKNEAFIADEIFPIIDMDSPRGKIWQYDPGSFFRNEAAKRNGDGSARRTGLAGDWVNISPVEYALAAPVTAEDRKNARLALAPPLQPDEDAVALASNALLLKKEILIEALVEESTWADGNGSGGEDAGGLWAATDSTNTLIADVQKAFRTIYGAVGHMPGLQKCMVIDRVGVDGVLDALAKSDYHKYANGGVPSVQWLQQLLGLDKLIVGESYYDSGAEKADGSQNSMAQIWEVTATKGMAFCYVRPVNPQLKSVMPGVQAREKFGADKGGGIRSVRSWNEPNNDRDVYEVAESLHIVQVCAEAGYAFQDIIVT